MSALKEIESEISRQQAIIDAAYWTFIHCAKGKPPVLVVPEAYKLRNQLRAQRRLLINDRK